MVNNAPASQPAAGRAYLDVPFADKEAAKALGAYWDQVARRWYDPNPPTTGLDHWAVRPDVPDLLPGEDRTFGDGSFVNMVPKSCWFTNVRTCVTQQDWERLRRMITTRAGQRCEACGASEDRPIRRSLVRSQPGARASPLVRVVFYLGSTLGATGVWNPRLVRRTFAQVGDGSRRGAQDRVPCGRVRRQGPDHRAQALPQGDSPTRAPAGTHRPDHERSAAEQSHLLT